MRVTTKQPALGLVLLAGATLCLLAAAPPPQVDRLIRQLGSDRYAQRESATQALDRLGGPALPALRKAAGSPDPEVRRRARRLVAAIARRLSGEVLTLRGHSCDVT